MEARGAMCVLRKGMEERIMMRYLDWTSACFERSIVSSARNLALIAFLTVCGFAAAQDRPVPDTYTATTTGMTPAGQGLRFVVSQWSEDGDRAAVVSVLGGEESPGEVLPELASVGAVWLDGSGAGYAIKYAHRAATDDGGEIVTLVTDKPVGSYNFRPWSVENPTATETVEYSVVELRLDASGNGVGTMSLAADVAIDDEANTVSLEIAEATPDILTDVTLEPKPYWARDDG